MRVYIFGTGKKSGSVIRCLDQSLCRLVGFIDNNPQKLGRMYMDYPVYRLNEEMRDDAYILVSVVNYESIRYQLIEWGIPEEYMIFFYSRDCFEEMSGLPFMRRTEWELELLHEEKNRLEYLLRIRVANAIYEKSGWLSSSGYWFPRIESGKAAAARIVEQGCSLIRFGDGEFDLMSGRAEPVFQQEADGLGERLKEAVQMDEDRLLIAVADNYGDLSQYTEETADGIRSYMTDEVRAFHASLLNSGRVYYDAYMFKCYMPYRDKSAAHDRIKIVKSIWADRDVTIIEGEYTRTGVANDLLSDAASVERILCPTKNAYSLYEKIYKEASAVAKSRLILIALGPAGKVLALDLFRAGYQVVDIGQIDMDYEWYRKGVLEKVHNSGKYVSQLPEAEVADVNDELYESQIKTHVY